MKTKVHSKHSFALLLAMPVILSILLAGCDENKSPAAPNEDNIVDILNADADYTVLAELIEVSELNNTLSGSANYTVFAPTDAAFAKLPEGTLEALTNTQRLEILRYHVIPGRIQVNSSSYNETHESLQGDPLFVMVETSTGTINNSAAVTSKNQSVSNGIIHKIDEVLFPDTFGTIGENLRKRYSYATLIEQFEDLDLSGLLEEEGHLSLIIPPTNSFEDLGSFFEVELTDEQITEIWKYNMVREDITGIGPGTQIALETVMGDSLYVSMEQAGQYLFNQYITMNQLSEVIHSSNGAIYFVDGVPAPDKFHGVLTLMDKRHYLRTVRSAMAVAKMTGRMYNSDNNADEQFTVFMPRNDAQGINTLPEGETELANILKYHVLLEKIKADELQHNQTYTTWQSEEITITRNGDNITINGTATIKLADLEGNNGVVHVIDSILTP